MSEDEAVAARARLEVLRSGAEALEATPEPDLRATPDRSLPAKVTLGAALLALLAGR